MRYLLALLAGLAACDFAPVLDIELPEHERALFLSGVVAADSAITVRAGVSRDPYLIFGGAERDTTAITVLLQRDGFPDERLRERDGCFDYDYSTGREQPVPCGAFETPTTLAPGEQARIVARAAGLPDAVVALHLPARPDVSLGDVTVTTVDEGGDFTRDRFDIPFMLRDRAGADRYALSVVQAVTYEDCEYQPETETCEPFLRTTNQQLGYQSADPVLLAGARFIPDSYGVTFVTFSDELFDGTDRRLALTAERAGFVGGEPPRLRLAALSQDLYDAYAITYFSLGSDNPFAEPADLPSNVTGGYGLVGTVSLTEVRLDG